jgi:hypothetical protein
MGSCRGIYRVKFKLRNGRDGGWGETQSFKTNANSAQSAGQKKKKKGAMIVSVRMVRKA